MSDCDRCGKPIDVWTENNGEITCLDCKEEEEELHLFEARCKAKAAMQGGGRARRLVSSRLD
jgi:hypothetical protein